MHNITSLQKGEKGIIKEFEIDSIPLKLIEMGCLPGNTVQIVQFAPFQDPLYINLNGSYVAIRQETAAKILIEKLSQ